MLICEQARQAHEKRKQIMDAMARFFRIIFLFFCNERTHFWRLFRIQLIVLVEIAV